MGKTGKWIRSFLTGKKEKEKNESVDRNQRRQRQQDSGIASLEKTPATPITIPRTTPKEKRRWSFRRSSAAAPGQKDFSLGDTIATTPPSSQMAFLETEDDQKKHPLAVAAATAAAADAAVAAAKAAAAVIQLTAVASRRSSAIEETAATKIQSVFRAYLARKALNALKGLVKLQALVRGHLVRKQATATLRCMQALVTVQARARAQRIQTFQESKTPNYNLKQFNHRKSIQENRSWNSYQNWDRGMEENIKIVEMDVGDSKGSTKSSNSYSIIGQTERMDQRMATIRASPKPEQISPSPSAVTDLSPRAYSNHFEEYSFGTAQSSPQDCSSVSKPDPSGVPFGYARLEYGDSLYNDYPFYPSYMANTESSRAKVRSHSAPKQRPESFERQPSRRRPSMEGRNVPRAVRMQRSSSHVGSAAQNYQYPWSIKLDRSAISLKDSECGSTTSVLTNANYCRSLVGFEVHGGRY